jgi:hypothetical protein
MARIIKPIARAKPGKGKTTLFKVEGEENISVSFGSSISCPRQSNRRASVICSPI